MTEREILELYRPETYCLDLPDTGARERLVAAGWIEWVPGQAWSGTNTYAITEAGRLALNLMQKETT